MTNPNLHPREFTIIGHRGAAGLAPENTLLSIDTAIRVGAAWVEVDVQHHDGQLWAMHDLSVDRTTNGHGLLTDLSAVQIRKLDAGRGEPVPTLPEVLDLVEQRVGINIELKTWNGCAAAVAACLKDYLAEGWSPSRIMVSSFHLPELWEFKQLLPQIPLGVLYCGVPLDWAGIAFELGARCLNISGEFVDTKLLADAHQRDLRVNVYTVNQLDELQRLRAVGVDGVFTDYPDRMLAASKA